MPPKLALPGNLLKEMGVSGESNGAPRDNSRWKSQNQNRRDRRKAERSQKRQGPTAPRRTPVRAAPRRQVHNDADESADDSDARTAAIPMKRDDGAKAVRNTLESNKRKRKRSGKEAEDDEDDEEASPVAKTTKTLRKMKEKFAQDDAEIDDLERKLGIKKGRKSLPKAFQEDGLDGLLGSDEDEDDSERDDRTRAKREADEWLAKKRRKAAKKEAGVESEEELDNDDSDLNDGFSGLLDDEDEDDDSIGDFIGDDDEDQDDEDNDEGSFGGFGSAQSKPRVRENPYVAPVIAAPGGQSAGKYIPPSLRKALGKDADLEAQIRRKTQGPVNRVTEANLVSIVGEIEKIYREHPRGLVTDILSDLLMAQICDATSKPDTLLVLSAGFIAALYKVIGIDFAAHFVTAVVERFQKEHDAAEKMAAEQRTPTKETSNLITVLAEMYEFKVVSGKLLFDYIKFLLQDLSELNAEILLRIVRLAGSQLRKDDPLALKDIVSLIRPAVAKIGEANLSVRTKFMIETISDLKNNKLKTGAQDLAVLHEHVTRMKKHLGTMDTTKLKSTEPLRMGLDDIQAADKSGKWWLVGAKWAGQGGDSKKAEATATSGAAGSAEAASDDDMDIDDGLDMPNYAELAREQGMNTDVRRAIFIALVAAADFNDAYLRILKLRLNKYNRREISNVLVQCSGAQQHYNPYYTLVASKFCGDSRIKYAFQDTLWTFFRRLGEPLFGEEPEEEDEEMTDNRRIINTAKMFGNLVMDSSVSLTVLKPLNMAYVKETTGLFVEVMLITVLQGCIKKDPKTVEVSLGKIFTNGIAPEFARTLRYFLRKKVRKTDLVDGKKETAKVKGACRMVEEMLEQLELREEE
ncbi:hypothetical protein ACHAQH_001459 [Verticillium albo-atrum]